MTIFKYVTTMHPGFPFLAKYFPNIISTTQNAISPKAELLEAGLLFFKCTDHKYDILLP